MIELNVLFALVLGFCCVKYENSNDTTLPVHDLKREGSLDQGLELDSGRLESVSQTQQGGPRRIDAPAGPILRRPTCNGVGSHASGLLGGPSRQAQAQ